MPVKAIPEGYHTATPYLVLRNAAQAIEYYKKAFGAQELMRMPTPDGKIAHAEIKIGDSVIMLSDESDRGASKSPQTLGGTTAGVMLYVEDTDAVFKRAIDAGGKTFMPPTDMFWGDRFGQFTDPFGQEWSIATHKEDVAPAEMEKRMKQFQAQMAQQPAQKKSA
ncbi:MAG TPA: VOC family protein [Terriglobales bacterium]|jgi:PhnB protein